MYAADQKVSTSDVERCAASISSSASNTCTGMRSRSYARAAAHVRASTYAHVRTLNGPDALDDVVSGFSRTRQAGGPWLRRIRPAPETPPDAEDVDKTHRSASEGDSTFLIPVPRDPDLADRQPRTIGERQHLHVERKAVDRQVRTDRLDRGSAEQLEAALRVADAADDEGADEPVEGAPDDVTDPGLVEALGAGRLPGSDHQRRATVAGVLEKAGEIVGRRRQIGVGHEAPLAAGLEQPAFDGLALSAVGEGQQADSVILAPPGR